MADLGQAYVQVVPSAEGISGQIAKLFEPEARSAGEAGGISLGGALTKTVAALGVGKTIADSISNGMNFESGMAKVSTLFSGTSDELAALQERIMGISSETGVAASALTEAAYSAESASVPMGNLGAMIEASSKLATAGFTDIDTALSATAKTMNAYGMVTDDVNTNNAAMEQVQRILIQTQNKGITTVGELGASLANVTPTAAAAGVGFEQVGAALAQMTAKGTPTAQATTQLRSAIAELEKSGTKASLALEQAAEGTQYAGMSFTEMMASGADLSDVMAMLQKHADDSGLAMLDLWSSVEGGNAAMAIVSDVGTYKDNLEAMGTSADVVGDAFSTMSDTASFKMQVMKNSLTNIGIDAFTLVADGFVSALGGIQTIIETAAPAFGNLGESAGNFFSKFSESMGELTGAGEDFSLVQTVADGLAGAVNGLAAAFDFLSEHMDIVIPVVTGLGAAFVAFKVGSGIASIVATFTALSGAITAAGGLVAAFTALLGPIGLVAIAIGVAVAAGVAIYKNWDKIKEAAGTLKKAVTEKWNSLKEGVVNAAENLKASASEKWNSLKTSVTEKAGAIKEAASEKFTAMKSKATEIFGNLKESASDKLSAMKDTASGIFEAVRGLVDFSWGLPSINTDVIENAREFVGNAIERIKDILDFDWSFPHIKMPHFSWDWVNIGGVVSVPRISVDWYRKAYENPYIFSSPTIIGNRGFGDGPGREMVYVHDNLMDDIREAVKSAGTGVFAPVINVYTQEGQSNEEIAQYVMDRLNREYGRAGKAFA